MPDDEVQFQSPTTGKIQPVPQEHWDEALKQGYTPTTHKVMYSPEGKRGMVPNEEVPQKGRDQYTTTPKTATEVKTSTGERGTGSGFKSSIEGLNPFTLKNLAESALLGPLKPAMDIGRAAFSTVKSAKQNYEAGKASMHEVAPETPFKPALETAAGVSGAVAPMVGVNPQTQRQRAERGDTGGIVGENILPVATAALPLIHAGVQTETGRAATSAVTAPVKSVATKVSGMFDRLRIPEAQKAMTQAIQPGVNIPKAQESISIAGPRMQQIRAENNIQIPEKGPEAVKATLDLNRMAKQQILEAIQDRMGPVAELKPTATKVAKGIRGSIDELTLEQTPGAREAMERRAGTYERDGGNAWSLKQMEERMHTLNNRLASAYNKPTGGEAKLSAETEMDFAEARELRKLIDGSVSKLSGDGVKDLKREYGAQRDVEKALARQYAIATRVKGAPLWEGLAYLHAAGDLMSGNLMGAAKAAATLTVGHRLQMLRDPGALLNQSFHGDKAFAPAQPIPQHVGPPAPKGLLPKPATEAGFTQEDTSGSVRGGRYTTPAALIGEGEPQRAQFIREVPKPKPAPKGLLPSSEAKLPSTNIPPAVEENFAKEALGTVRDQSKLGERGRGGVSTGGEPPTNINVRSSQTGPQLLPSEKSAAPEAKTKTVAEKALQRFKGEGTARGARTPNKPMLKDIGLTLRGEFPPGYYDFQDMQTGGTVAFKKEGFTEQGLRDKVKAHREAMRNTPPEGKSDLAAEKARNAQARASAEETTQKKTEDETKAPVQETLSEHELADAEGLIKSEVGMLQTMDRPGRYYDQSTEEEHTLAGRRGKGERMGGQWRGVKSGRNMMPFMRDHPDVSPSQAAKAMEKDGTNPTYQRLMRDAVEFIRNEKKKKEG